MRVEECVVSNDIIDLVSEDDSPWSAIVVDDAVKAQIRNQALLSLLLRTQLGFASTALHGTIVLYGPPGTGKTTLARGLATQLAPHTATKRVRRIEINAHELMSAEHGKSQQQVWELLAEHIPALAGDGLPTIVVLDEVESMVVARSQASLSANPADVHRATDAALTALDENARNNPHIMFVATSNFTTGLDEAFMSRADAAVLVPAPDERALAAILAAVLTELGRVYPPLRALAHEPALADIARELDGIDGRRARKFVFETLSHRLETVVDPGKLELADMMAAAHRFNEQGAAA